MKTLVIIEKNGTPTTKKVKSLKLDDLYKKCNFRSENSFGKQHTFKAKQYYLHVFGKTSGKATTENKFEFPPPIDTSLFFGNMAIIKTEKKELLEETVCDYTIEEWNKDYEYLMGGFENIGSDSENDYESDELEHYSQEQITKTGYLKDGFIVEDEEQCDIEGSLHDSSTIETYKSDDEDSSVLTEEEYESEEEYNEI